MNYIGMFDMLKDINQLEEEFLSIALVDREEYEYFSNKISALKQELFHIEDNNLNTTPIEEQEIIRKLQELKFEFNQYLQTGQKDNDEIKLVFSKNEISISGKENRKRYRINLYKSILEDLKKFSNIDLERLRQLRLQWEEEKQGNLGFSPVEIDMLEEVFADVFLGYQIKNLQKNGIIIEESFTEFCEQEKYEKKLKEKLLETIQSLDKGTRKRLDLEQLFTSGNVENIANSTEFWAAASGVDVKGKIKIDFNPPAEIEEKESSIQETRALVPVYNHSRKRILVGIRFQILGKTMQIKKKFKISPEGVISIPDKLQDKVFEIAFPEGMTTIEEIGLTRFKNLEQVYLPDSLKQIGRGAFDSCTELKKVKIPQSIERIGEKAFYNCFSLQEIDLKESQVIEIENHAFESCYKMQEIKLPKTLEKIGEGAFIGCSKLKEIKMPQSLEWIGPYAFYGCNNLDKVDLRASQVREIGEEAFYNSGLRKIDFSKGLRSIGNRAFSKTKVEHIELPNSVDELGEGAFRECTALNKVKLSDNIQEIKSSTFSGCISLEEISLPQNLTEIKGIAFMECFRLKEILLPKKIKKVWSHAFAECESLKSVKVENGERNIEIAKNAFPPGVKFKKVSSQQRDGDDYQQVKSDARKNWTDQEETNVAKAGNDWVL